MQREGSVLLPVTLRPAPTELPVLVCMSPSVIFYTDGTSINIITCFLKFKDSFRVQMKCVM